MAKNTKIYLANGNNVSVEETMQDIQGYMPIVPYHMILHLSNGKTIWLMTKAICYMEDLR